MAFKYDFDMFSVMPAEIQQEFQGMFAELGMGNAMGQQVALFRDPALVEALTSADEQVKTLFLDAGFGLNVYDSGAPDGRYPGKDEEARNECVRKLADNIAAADGLSQANWGGFSLEDFLEHLVTAKPVEDAAAPVVPSAASFAPVDDFDAGGEFAPVEEAPARKKMSFARLGLVAGGAMLMVSTVGIVLSMVNG